MTAFDYASIALLIAFIAANWFVPRHLGVVGIVLVQVALLIGYFVLAAVAIGVGRYEYDGLLSIVGLALQAFLLNCLLLPIGLFALWRRRRRAGHGPGFPMAPRSPDGSRLSQMQEGGGEAPPP